MIIEEALQAYLIGTAGVSAQIGDRLYPDLIPQDADLPAAAYQVITTSDDLTQDGPSGWTEITLQITVDADKYKDAKTAMRAIHTALNGYSGILSGVEIYFIRRTNSYDGYGEASEVRTIRSDYSVQYQET